MGFSDMLNDLIIEFEEYLVGKGDREGEIDWYKEEHEEMINKAEIVIKVMNCFRDELVSIDWTSIKIKPLLPEKETKEIMEIYKEIDKKADKIDEIHKEVVKITRKKFKEAIKKIKLNKEVKKKNGKK